MFYIYDNETKEYLKETVGQPSPLEPGTFFTPANSTLISPPSTGSQQKAVWDADSSQWSVVDDNRKQNCWNIATKEKIELQLGDSITGAMTSVEPSLDPAKVWNGSDWEVPLVEAKKAKYADIYAQADYIIAEQEATFYPKGNNIDRNKDRLARAQSKRTNKKTKGQPLSANEQDADDRYDSLMDWADSVYDIADTSGDVVELMATTAEVEAYVVETRPVWPVWTPPV